MQRGVALKNGRLQLTDAHRWNKPDGLYVIDPIAEKSKATHPMKAYLFSYVYPTIAQEMSGLVNKKEIYYLHSELKDRYGATELTDVISHNSSKIFHNEELKAKSLSKYTYQEMLDYWMAIQSMAARFFKLNITDPDPDWKLEWGEWENKHAPKKSVERQIKDKVIDVL